MMKSYLCRLHVKLQTPMESDGDLLTGYYINLGVDAENEEEAFLLGSESILDGMVEKEDSEVFEADRRTVHKDILAQRPPVQVKGVWYRSGRALFLEET